MNNKELLEGTSVVVKSCTRSEMNGKACHCLMLVTRTDQKTNSPKQAWFDAHGKAGLVLKNCSNTFARRCMVEFTMRDGTTWKSPPFDLTNCTIFRDGWPHPPQETLMPIDVMEDAVADRRSDDESDPTSVVSRTEKSREKTRAATLDYQSSE